MIGELSNRFVYDLKKEIVSNSSIYGLEKELNTHNNLEALTVL